MTSSKSQAKVLTPDFYLEEHANGPVCGLDEVGRGPLAGPVVSACVFIPKDKRNLDFIADIKDSKKLSNRKLAKLFDLICEHCAYGIAEISPEKIDEINILQASLRAMENAYTAMNENMSCALVDGNRTPNLPCQAQTVVKGDSRSKSIAAASILAKVTRDRLMAQLAQEHPHYGWERNVGYPTKEHMAAIDLHGITPHHRRSFAPVRNFLEHGSTQCQLAFGV